MLIRDDVTIGHRNSAAVHQDLHGFRDPASVVGLTAQGQNNDVEVQLKTIGVLGGIGPQATMDFEVRVHRISQRLVPQRHNSGYPGMVVHYCRHAPAVLTEEGEPKRPFEPDPRLIDAARWLGAMTNFLVIPSNFTHLFSRQIEQAAGIPVLNMIELVLAEVARRRWTKVGVLGFGLPKVYTEPLGAMGIAYETLDPAKRSEMDLAIMSVMEGRDSASSTVFLEDCIGDLRAREVNGIVLGCTELPLLLPSVAGDADLINPVELLAEAAVRKAMEP